MVADHDLAGYYQVGPVKTYSKVESIDLHHRTRHHPEWRFNDAVFASYDWSQEPRATLAQLYQSRARQIRDKYDRVVIFYSGGIDSQNIIDSFVAAGCAIDEIATTDYHSIDPDPMSFFNIEQTMVSFPYLEKLKGHGVQFRHRRIDLTEMANDLIQDQKFFSDYIFYCNRGFGINRLAKARLRDAIPDYRQWIEQGLSVAFVWGVDKPRLYLEQDRFCLRFIDLVIDIAVSPYTQMQAHPRHFDELFYWSPDACDLLCKQGHVIKNFLRNTQLDKLYQPHYGSAHLLQKELLKLPPISGRKISTQRDLINSLLYDQYSPTMFDSNNKVQTIFSDRDKPWLKDVTVNEKYLDVLKYLEKLDSYWLNDPTNHLLGLKGCLSPCYFLER